MVERGDSGPPASRERSIRTATALALVAVGIAQLGDLLTFARMLALRGPAAELNPIVATIAVDHGLLPLVALKLLLIVFIGACFAVVAGPRPRLAASVVTFATLAGLVGALSNVVSAG